MPKIVYSTNLLVDNDRSLIDFAPWFGFYNPNLTSANYAVGLTGKRWVNMKIYFMGKTWTTQDGIDHIKKCKLHQPTAHDMVTLAVHNDKKLAKILQDYLGVVALCEKPWTDPDGYSRVPSLYEVFGTREVGLDPFDYTWNQNDLLLAVDPQI